jgi:hypothetical protein
MLFVYDPGLARDLQKYLRTTLPYASLLRFLYSMAMSRDLSQGQHCRLLLLGALWDLLNCRNQYVTVSP